MILIGLGANLPSALGPPQATLTAALAALEGAGVCILARSRWYRSEAIPASDQPWFVNAVAALATTLDPAALMRLLHCVEASFGRERQSRNEARPIDLDLLDFDGLVQDGDGGPILPHPRLHLRTFVLLPLAEIAPQWRHPRFGLTVAALLAALPPGQTAEPLPADAAPPRR
ncbi:MAG TPA: 2-amino-4-hydroxy-6-hydroxymethyldihydropteridine diphosphokinase [Stellaceae bacterium]|nr:2-amino-4-hydroxy-6-hydroxymethyldihydropteridine diphosphokinase [Stellaceae bacterium]